MNVNRAQGIALREGVCAKAPGASTFLGRTVHQSTVSEQQYAVKDFIWEEHCYPVEMGHNLSPSGQNGDLGWV